MNRAGEREHSPQNGMLSVMPSRKSLHRRTAERVATQLLREGSAVAVVLHGSVAQETHQATSDIDLVAVGPGSPGLETFEVNGLRVEVINFTADEWKARFARPIPAWTYAWSEGIVLCQSGNTAAPLVAEASEILRLYRPQRPVLLEHVEFWSHVRPKLANTLARGDLSEIGYAMGLSTQRLIESLFLSNDVVPPPLSNARTFSRLVCLPVPQRLDARLKKMLAHPDVITRAQEKLSLIDDILISLNAKILPSA